MRSLISGLSLHKLEVFCMVAELESVSRAADRLGIAQPAVSSHLKILAQKVGVQLFHQQGRKMLLTETGKRVRDWASEIVSRTRELERELDEGAGSAVVGASMTVGSYVLPGLLSNYRTRRKTGQIDLRISTPLAIMDSIHAGHCDFAFTLLSDQDAVSGLDVREVYEEDLILVGSPKEDHLRDRVALGDLEDLPFISARSNSARRRIEDQLLSKHGVERKDIILALEHAEAIKQAVRSGAGVAFLLRSSVQHELKLKLLEEVRVDGLRLSVPIYLIQRSGKRMSAFQRKLADELMHQLLHLSHRPPYDNHGQ